MKSKGLFLGYASSALLGVWLAGLKGIAGLHLLQSAVLAIAIIALLFLRYDK
ncbi:hypothetical protein [Shewanella sp. Scap07]|uniref:hypothetical protein n=1 Tax=Shewanella sp. Scap07 TaxID=2589987 RepID=UPI0015BBA8FA|nr:hypothetical protein [Shewanella sp. Scap07]